MDDVPAHATTILDLSTLLEIDAVTHEIVASELTPDNVGDVSEMPGLLDQIDAEVASMTADGAYDREGAYAAVAERHPEAAVIIPPRMPTDPLSLGHTTKHSNTGTCDRAESPGFLTLIALRLLELCCCGLDETAQHFGYAPCLSDAAARCEGRLGVKYLAD